MIKEGGKAVYAGEDVTIGQGSVGRVLVVAAQSAHVQWLDGPRMGMVDLIDGYDLAEPNVPTTIGEVVAAQFDQGLDIPSDSQFVREAMDNYGEDGVLAALEEAGQLAVLATYATEAIEHLSGALRADPALREMLATLDDYEQETVLARLTSSLLDTEEEAS